MKEFDEVMRFIEEEPKLLINEQALIQTAEMPKFKVTNRQLQ